MKTNQGKTVTLGDLIESGYRACGNRRAKAVLRLAAKVRLIVLQPQGAFRIS
jgi:hypothetical protein